MAKKGKYSYIITQIHHDPVKAHFEGYLLSDFDSDEEAIEAFKSGTILAEGMLLARVVCTTTVIVKPVENKD